MTRTPGVMLALLWCGGVGALVCAGQEVWYLSPRSFELPVGAQIEVMVEHDGALGVDGVGNAEQVERADQADQADHADEVDSLRAFPSAVAEHVFVRGGGRQWNLHHPAPIEAEGAWVRLPAPAVGAAMIGLQAQPVVETYSAAQFRAFIAERAPAFEVMTIPEQGEVRVRVVRCAKTLVRVNDEQTRGWASPVPLSKAGQRSEIRLNADPTVFRVVGENGAAVELPVRLYADWGSRQGVTFRATNTTTGERFTMDANDTGNGTIVVNAPGVWHVEFHYLIAMDADATDNRTGVPEGQAVAREGQAERNDDQAAVDFELHSATLTFEVRAGGSR